MEKIRIISGIALIITLIFLIILGSVVLPLSVIGTAWPTSE
ncbi:phosphohistidine phosphatase [Bacillus pseudomycoides]|nr:phosphohistidine phosphatase [Bacillus pseudomycoides]PFX36141.1 phosphohistidine phosphatase [Bacillus pseudomycoides]